MTSIAGKKAVITGGTTGIGRAIAEALLERGAEVLVTGRSEENLERAKRALGSRAHALRSNAASLSDIDALRDEVARLAFEATFTTGLELKVDGGITTIELPH